MRMNPLKRAVITATLFTSMLAFNPFNVVPFIDNAPSTVQAAIAPTDEPQADDIGWVYRQYNGWLQRRRWNYTKGYWVDPNWITLTKL